MLDSEGEWPRMRIAIAGKTQSRKYAKKKYARGGLFFFLDELEV